MSVLISEIPAYAILPISSGLHIGIIQWMVENRVAVSKRRLITAKARSREVSKGTGSYSSGIRSLPRIVREMPNGSQAPGVE